MLGFNRYDRPTADLRGGIFGGICCRGKLSPKHPCGFRSVMCLLFPHHPFPSVPAVIFPFCRPRPTTGGLSGNVSRNIQQDNPVLRRAAGGTFLDRESINPHERNTDCGEKMFACAASEKLVLVLSCSQPSLRESCRGRYIRKCGGPCRPASHQTDKDDPGEAVSRVLVVSDRPGDHRIRD